MPNENTRFEVKVRLCLCLKRYGVLIFRDVGALATSSIGGRLRAKR